MRRLRRRRNNIKTRTIFSLLFILVCSIGIGSAYISWQLDIDAEVIAQKQVWKIIPQNIEASDENIILDEENVILKFKPNGDNYSFNFDIVNDGTIDGMIKNIKLESDLEEDTSNINYSIKYESTGSKIKEKDALLSHTKEKVNVTINNYNLEGNIILTIEYERKDDTAVIPNTIYYKLTTDYIENKNVNIMDNIYFYNQYSNNNNVLIDNICFKAIRSTTSGVKLLYNGITDNGSCDINRKNEFNLGKVKTINAYDNEYFYATNYKYNEETKEYVLDGIKNQYKVNEENKENIIGKYTCRNIDENSSCNSLYIVSEFISDNTFKAYKIENLPYDVIASTQYNEDALIGSAGYMYNRKYNVETISLDSSIKVMSREVFNKDYLYADSYNKEEKYTLINPIRVENASEAINKYTIGSINELDSSDTIKYIVAVSNNYVYYKEFSEEVTANNYLFSDSYKYNDDGTYTLNNPISIDISEWQSRYKDAINKYTCGNNNDTCKELKYVLASTQETLRVEEESNKYKYSNNVTFDNGQYTLSGDSQESSDWHVNKDNINNTHYTCLNSDGVCSEVYYIIGYNSYENSELTSINVIRLSNGELISDVINNSLNKEDTNMYESNIKKVVEKWYANTFDSHSNYVEDAVYCNNRIIDEELLNKSTYINNGRLNSPLLFNNKDLNCREEDSFNLINEKAKLKYPVGLLTKEEIDIINKDKDADTYLFSKSDYFTMSSSSILNESKVYTIKGESKVNDTLGVRPVVTIRGDSRIVNGNGSENTPYIIKFNNQLEG